MEEERYVSLTRGVNSASGRVQPQRQDIPMRAARHIVSRGLSSVVAADRRDRNRIDATSAMRRMVRATAALGERRGLQLLGNCVICPLGSGLIIVEQQFPCRSKKVARHPELDSARDDALKSGAEESTLVTSDRDWDVCATQTRAGDFSLKPCREPLRFDPLSHADCSCNKRASRRLPKQRRQVQLPLAGRRCWSRTVTPISANRITADEHDRYGENNLE